MYYANIYMPREKYAEANELINAKQYDEALEIYLELGDYKDSIEMCNTIPIMKKYDEAVSSFDNGDYENAYSLFIDSKNYRGAKNKAYEAAKRCADVYFDNEIYDMAVDWYELCANSEEIEEKLMEAKYQLVVDDIEHGKNDRKTTEYMRELESINYKDIKEIIENEETCYLRIVNTDYSNNELRFAYILSPEENKKSFVQTRYELTLYESQDDYDNHVGTIIDKDQVGTVVGRKVSRRYSYAYSECNIIELNVYYADSNQLIYSRTCRE